MTGASTTQRGRLSPELELAAMLRPAGGGVYTVSTGRAEQEALQRILYGARDAHDIDARWREAIRAVAASRIAILAIPSDCGAGLVRGASFGPQGLRAAILDREPRFAELARADGIVDVGDVFTVPHLLHDEMLSAPQIEASRAALYGADPDMRQMPVSPLSIAERAVSLLLAVNPDLQLMVLGGDHSVAWPVLSALARVQREPWAIVHIDAHTDLLPERLGVKYCFATWAYHANQLLGGGGRLIQIGIRASGKTREHWEQTLGVRQIWADEALARGADAVVAEVVAHLRAIGARRVYFSNDIDGTDAALAPSTGAPASGGLSVEMVRALINGVGQVFPFVGADLVEVAPPIGSAEDARRTTAVGACYILDTIGAMLGATGEKWRKTAAAMATTVTAATTARP